MIRQYELVERVKAYDASADEDLLNRAYVFAMHAHGSQKRASGDPYFSHPLEVAGLLTSLKLDSASIATALLHDTVEDTDTTLEEIEDNFGPDICRLVDGVTKLSRLELQSDATKHAENFRKLLLAMSEDIRVLLVKLADRLHNMRTLNHVRNPDKRRRIALETLEIYAPLAERIGMQKLKDELEDWSFRELNPDAHQSIVARLDFLRAADNNLVGRIVESLKQTLSTADLEATVSGREKSPYSIWRKMQRNNVSFEQLSDIIAFRVLVDSVEACYQALGVLHGEYAMVPGRFKDYISTPKPNSYQSLHTTVMGPEKQRIEIQIRTHEMHAVSELGVAAHWKYKQGVPGAVDGKQYYWLRELLDIMENASSPEEFLEHTKLAMFQDQVFCFTPKGDLISLSRGATPVDFAYAVHSEIGDRCVGSKVNGHIVPLRTQLENGDQVEILTSRAQTPSPTWERFVVTAKARARIRRFVRGKEREQYEALGRSIIHRAFVEEGYSYTDKAVEGVLKVFRCASVEDLFVLVGKGNHTGREVIHAIFPGSRKQAETEAEGAIPTGRGKSKQAQSSSKVPIRGLIPGMALHFAGCCHPLPGDRIVGIVHTGKGVTIHTIDCDTLEQYVDEPERWLDLAWETDAGEEGGHIGRIHTLVANMPGVLGVLGTVIARNGGNIFNLKITDRSQDVFELLLDIEVTDVKHLTHIIAALRATPEINSVERARG